MKKTLSRLFTFLLLTTSVGIAQSTTLNTVPEGLLSLDIATTTSSPSTSYFSLPLTADPVYTGAVSAVTSNTISVADSPAPFVNGNVGVQLGAVGTTANEPFFVKFLSGAEAGRMIRVTANTSSALTLDITDNTSSSQNTPLTTTGFAVAVGDTFEVIPGGTLGSVFGDGTPQNPPLLHGSTSPFSADTVSIYNPLTSKFQTFYFNTTSTAWQVSGTSTNATNTIVYPFSSVVILRRGSQTAVSIVPMARVTSLATVGGSPTDSLVPMSRVPEVASLIKTPGGIIYSSTQYPIDMTLAQLNLGSHWTKASSAFAADTISIWNPTTSKFKTYYQVPDSTWRQTTDASTDVSSLVVPAGTTIASCGARRAAVQLRF